MKRTERQRKECVMRKSYQVKLSLANQIRMNKATAKCNKRQDDFIIELIHDFFQREGVKNLNFGASK